MKKRLVYGRHTAVYGPYRSTWGVLIHFYLVYLNYMRNSSSKKKNFLSCSIGVSSTKATASMNTIRHAIILFFPQFLFFLSFVFFWIGRWIFNRSSRRKSQVIERGLDPVGSKYFDRNPDWIPTERNPAKTVSDPIGFSWKMSDSDEIRHGSDRFPSDLQVGSIQLGYPKRFNPTISSDWNPTRLHKDPVGIRVVDRHSDP